MYIILNYGHIKFDFFFIIKYLIFILAQNQTHLYRYVGSEQDICYGVQLSMQGRSRHIFLRGQSHFHDFFPA